MRNFFKLFGIIAIAAVIGFSFVSCEEIKEEAAKTLVITDIPDEQVSNLQEKSVTIQNSKGAGIAQGTIGTISGGIATVELLDILTKEPWTGSGDFTVSILATAWKVENVSFTEAKTTIKFADLLPN